jgi:hypothetical protein
MRFLFGSVGAGRVGRTNSRRRNAKTADPLSLQHFQFRDSTTPKPGDSRRRRRREANRAKARDRGPSGRVIWETQTNKKESKTQKNSSPHFHDCSFEREDNFRFKFEKYKFRVASILSAERELCSKRQILPKPKKKKEKKKNGSSEVCFRVHRKVLLVENRKDRVRFAVSYRVLKENDFGMVEGVDSADVFGVRQMG